MKLCISENIPSFEQGERMPTAERSEWKLESTLLQKTPLPWDTFIKMWVGKLQKRCV